MRDTGRIAWRVLNFHARETSTPSPSPNLVSFMEGRRRDQLRRARGNRARAFFVMALLKGAEMTTPIVSARSFKKWFFEGKVKELEGPHEAEKSHHRHSWWQVMCLTGVDYFSTLGYQPGIAFLAAGALSPVATLILVLLTLFGALPIYNRVARESPHGEGSISMLESLLPRWRGKMFVLALLGFVTTDFIITMTLSAADATAHIIENPLVPRALGRHTVLVTLALLATLGALFLKGFKEAIGLAVVLVAVYLLLNLVVVIVGIYEVVTHAEKIPAWR